MAKAHRYHNMTPEERRLRRGLLAELAGIPLTMTTKFGAARRALGLPLLVYTSRNRVEFISFLRHRFLSHHQPEDDPCVPTSADFLTL